MLYMGSKNRIAKHILPIILKDRKPNQWYVEPFVGGGNMIDKVDGLRIGADVNPYVVEALKFIRDNPESIPKIISEDMYSDLNLFREVDGLTGLVAFGMSFGGKFFGGYRREKAGTKGCKNNEIIQTERLRNNALNQQKGLKDTIFINCEYSHLDIPKGAIVYCDPPYYGTQGYQDGFDHDKFWQWCRDKSDEGYSLYISEYSAPDDFKSIWSHNLQTTFSAVSSNIKATEKLFIYDPFEL